MCVAVARVQRAPRSPRAAPALLRSPSFRSANYFIMLFCLVVLSMLMSLVRRCVSPGARMMLKRPSSALKTVSMGRNCYESFLHYFLFSFV